MCKGGSDTTMKRVHGSVYKYIHNVNNLFLSFSNALSFAFFFSFVFFFIIRDGDFFSKTKAKRRRAY